MASQLQLTLVMNAARSILPLASLLLLAPAGCSGGTSPTSDDAPREVDAQSFSVSYRNQVRLPWDGSRLTADRFASQVRGRDPLAAARCAPEQTDAFRDATEFLGGIAWTHGMTIVKDASLPPLYAGPLRISNADSAGASAAAPRDAAPSIERPDLVGVNDGVAVFLSKQHGLMAVDARNAASAPNVSCAMKVPGAPMNFFYKGSELVVVVNALGGHNRAALLRYEVRADGFTFKDAVKLPDQTVRDARLFDRTLVLYTAWSQARETTPIPTEPSLGSGPQYGSSRGGMGGIGAAPAYDGGGYVQGGLGSKVIVVNWDDALGVDWEDSLLDDPKRQDQLEGQAPGQTYEIGQTVSTWKTWQGFAAASDRYLAIPRSVQKSIFAGYQTTTYDACTSYNPKHHQVQMCSVKYEKRANPDYRAPSPTTGDYSCNGKKLADCIKEAAPVVSQYVYVPVGQACEMVWQGACEKYEARSETYPTFTREEETELVVYRFENGSFTKLDSSLAKMVQKSDAIAFETSPLTFKGTIGSRNQLQFQNGQLYVFADQALQTMSVSGNSIAYVNRLAVPANTSNAPAVVFSADRAMISAYTGGYPTPSSSVAMLDLAEPALPKLLTSFSMPGTSSQLLLAKGGILGPGQVSFGNSPGEVPRSLQKLTLFGGSDGQELDNLLLGTEYDSFASSWFSAEDDQRIRLGDGGARVFLPYAGRHHADPYEPTAYRLNVSRIEGGRLVSERSFQVSAEIIRTASLDPARALVFGDSATYLADRTTGDWALSTLRELFVPFATYRLSDTGLHARVDRVGTSCRVRTYGADAAVFGDAPLAEAKVPCGESAVPVGAGAALLFRETRTGVSFAPDGSVITALAAGDVAARLEALPTDQACWIEGGDEGGASVDYLDAVPARILCASTGGATSGASPRD